jgi:hypothetical protein
VTPADRLVRRMRELAMLLALSRESAETKDPVLAILRDTLARYDAECDDEARVDDAERRRENEP